MDVNKTEPTAEWFDYIVDQDYNNVKSGPYQFVHYEKTWIEDFPYVINKDEKILDIGCGPGKWYDSISKITKNYHGIDYSKNMINIAKKRNPEGKWTVADEKYIDGKFYDTIMEIQTLYVFPGHWKGFVNKFLNHCNRILLFEPEYRKTHSLVIGNRKYEVGQVIEITTEGISLYDRVKKQMQKIGNVNKYNK